VTNELQQVVAELAALDKRAMQLVARAGPQFARPPRPNSWSVAECLQHLSLTSEAYIPLLTKAIANLRGREKTSPYKLDWWGRALKWTLEPPPRFRFATTKDFKPVEIGDENRVLGHFLRLQSEITKLVRDADGLDLNAVNIRSPFSSHVRYNVYSAFVLIVAHERRHLWQAQKALEVVQGGGTAS
jgi:hypothetical protein